MEAKAKDGLQGAPAKICRDGPLSWRDVVAVADGAELALAETTRSRIRNARRLVQAIVEKGIRAYGISTGIGGLCNVLVSADQQEALSRNLILSHATGVGEPLGVAETRAIMTSAVNNMAHGYSGIRLETVESLLTLLNSACTPVVPSRGSVGYITHMAHVSLVLLGLGEARLGGRTLNGAAALAAIGQAPVHLVAKEGICLAAGTPCATGLGSVALGRTERLLAWADAVSAMSFENLHGSTSVFDAFSLGLRKAPGMQVVGSAMREWLQGSAILNASGAKATQDCISLRAIPHVHGAARDAFSSVSATLDEELASVTDNPVVTGTPEAPEVHSQAHGVGASIGLAMDTLAIAVAEVGAMSERRIDRLLNPLVSGLPAFLARGSGVASGLMIAQYAAASLVAENRRLALPATLDGGLTSGLQEDHLTHATPAALKLLSIIENVQRIVAIEYLAAAQAYDFQTHAPAPGTARLHKHLRSQVPFYADDRPLADDMNAAWRMISGQDPAHA